MTETNNTNNDMNTEEGLKAELERLKRENARLKQEPTKSGDLSCKIGEKGTVCVYGLGRFPVSLYEAQWDKLIAFIPVIQQVIKDGHANNLFPTPEEMEENKKQTQIRTKEALDKRRAEEAAKKTAA